MIFQTHSNGKLLLSGEYLVLTGAKALAIPLKLGQSLSVETAPVDGLFWESIYDDSLWFWAHFTPTLQIIDSSDITKASTIATILKTALYQAQINEGYFHNLHIRSKLDFHPDWGWGSSSTLIYNIAQWLKIDAFKLSSATLGGSNYDIACAGSSGPIYYQLNTDDIKIESAPFHPSFAQNLLFVYLGKKQNSRLSSKHFLKLKKYKTSHIQRITEISEQMANSFDLNNFLLLMDEHEQIISYATSQTPVKQLYFSDFNGSIKSLGAWGGDFILAASNESIDYSINFFKTKGYSVLFKYDEIILNNQ